MPKIKESKPVERVRVYSEGECRIFKGKDALTEEAAKTLLGWREAKEGETPLLTDLEGKKIVCTNNRCNRRFTRSQADKIMLIILRGQWQLNYETMIIGEYGSILSAQHRMIGLILACQAYRLEPEEYEAVWKKEPTIECVIAFGCSEEDKVVNTIDTGKSRTLGDVFYRSEYFRDIAEGQRNKVAKSLAAAIILIKLRTDHPEKQASHMDNLQFVDDHPTLLRCVRHIWDESGAESKIDKLIKSLGAASAMMYMMGSSNTTTKKYLGDRTEEAVDKKNFDKAEEFWSKFAADDKKFSLLYKSFVKLDNRQANVHERTALIVKAWHQFIGGNGFTESGLHLNYVADDDDVEHLAETPLFGGIDVGIENEYEDEYEEAEEIQAGKEALEDDEKPATGFKAGEPVTVKEPTGVLWTGTFEGFATTKKKGKEVKDASKVNIKVDEGFAGAGKIEVVETTKVRATKNVKKTNAN